MGITNFIKNICTKLGAQNKSTYPMVAIATANGICRPTFTMLKKGEDPDSKKYAALREGLTEAIAVPTYIISGELAGQVGKYIASKATDINIQKLEQQGQILSDKAKHDMKHIAIKKGQAGLMLVGVCTAAGLIIPALCTVAVKPIMDKIAKTPQDKKLDIKENAVKAPQIIPTAPITRPVFKNINYSGMKVGGV